MTQGRQVMLEIMDTAGTEQFSKPHPHPMSFSLTTNTPPAAMRDMYMRIGQGFLLVFSITSLSSLHELIELREQIVRTKNDTAFPMVLVGNKSDLEEDRKVSRAKAFQLSQSWGNIPYYETSARRDANVTEVFVDVCRQIIRRDMSRVQMRELERGGRMTGASGGTSSRRRRRRRREGGEYEERASRCTIL